MIDLISIDETRWIVTRISNTSYFCRSKTACTCSEVGFGQATLNVLKARTCPSFEDLAFSYHHHHRRRQRNDGCLLPYFRQILHLFFDSKTSNKFSMHFLKAISVLSCAIPRAWATNFVRICLFLLHSLKYSRKKPSPAWARG